MDAILASMSVSISTFKDNPSKQVREAHGQTFCVLNNNRPAFYVVSPETWDRILDIIDDAAIQPIAREAIARYDQAIPVDLETI